MGYRAWVAPAEIHGGSRFYRLTEPARVLESDDWSFHIGSEFDIEGIRQGDGTVQVSRVDVDGYDLVIVQRPLSQGMFEVVRQLREQNVPVVVDVDDDFRNVHRDNVAWEAINPALNPLHNGVWLRRSCELASLVTVSTPRLRKYAQPHNRSAVLRNRIPERARLAVTSPPEQVTLGWTGTARTHPADLQCLGDSVKSCGVPLSVVGDEYRITEITGVPAELIRVTPWADDVETYWANVGSSMSIGLAPLELSKFNHAKSALKPSEYMALGVPWVGSRSDEYVALRTFSGCGSIAPTPSHWRRMVQELIDDPELRQQQRELGLQYAAEHTLENHAHEWAAAWSSVL
jgi:glycosyltransferase involved in cell wall biosynthesis